MSLINKMLQDLDARGGAAQGAGLSDSVRAVAAAPARGRTVLLVVGAAAAVLLAAALVAWRFWPSTHDGAAGPAQAKGVIRPAAVAEKPQATPPEQMVDGFPVPAQDNSPAPQAPASSPVPDRAVTAAVAKPTGGADSGKARVRSFGTVASTKMRPIVPAPASAGGSVSPASREAGAQPSATALFQRAQAKLADGRAPEAIADLEAALEIDQHYLAARETLVAILMENGRHADAMRNLRRALAVNPEQAPMAMLLARLQLEHGSGAIDTLLRSLPYAESNAEYRAMLGALLERSNRHREAAGHYQAALQLQPANGVWWMGLGISLQAEKRNAEAKSAFQRALESGRLSPELQGFVERRLQQLD